MSEWELDNDGEAHWLSRKGASRYTKNPILFWADEDGAAYLNNLEAEVARYRTALEEILPHVQRWVSNLDYEYEAEAWLVRARAALEENV